ncbi:hypothetical protein FV139_10385 [Parahaliea maris]|uniref:PadR family transcriptional regulator n=1 Tax=Parahaliea maris TaxID=2716870 RepID=A0A5C8ZZK4_9GAMM|nr:hypothetical protein [Parahaliea maris]TXS94015.1 hypothetical protein FV139_10385 [Parahaliea maris]
MDTMINTTAYSLLGLLAKRDWTAAELARFMEHSVIRYILPRTRSQLFNEPKRLVKLGLARGRPAAAGGARGTVYSITPRGRRQLAAWLEAPGEGLRLEHKSLLKFYLTDSSNVEGLRMRVAEMRGQVLAAAREALALVSDINQRGVMLPQTAVAASLASGLAVSQYRGQLEWLAELENALDSLPAADEAGKWALTHYARTQRELEQLLGEYAD